MSLRAFVVVLGLSCGVGCSSTEKEQDPPKQEEVTEGEHHELTARYRLVLLQYEPLQAAKSYVIVEPREGEGKQRTLHVGDVLDGYEIVKIGLQADGVSALLTVKKDDKVEDIPMNS